jgi:NAD(P)-dependent dehydrogenase (short-subunit alcohol dehydrogenase family)
MAGRFEGKVVLITGAASGIGAATARRFAAEGARLMLGDINAKEGEVVAEQLGRGIDHVVPFERNVQTAANRGEPEVAAHPNSKFSQAVGGLAEEVLSEAALAAH